MFASGMLKYHKCVKQACVSDVNHSKRGQIDWNVEIKNTMRKLYPLSEFSWKCDCVGRKILCTVNKPLPTFPLMCFMLYRATPPQPCFAETHHNFSSILSVLHSGIIFAIFTKKPSKYL